MQKSKKFWGLMLLVFGLGLIATLAHVDIDDTDMKSVEYLRISIPTIGTIHLNDGRTLAITGEDSYDDLNDRFEVVYTVLVDGELACHFKFDQGSHHGGGEYTDDDIMCYSPYGSDDAFVMIPNVKVDGDPENTLQVEYVHYLHIPVQNRDFSMVLATGDRTKLITSRPLFSQPMTRISTNGFEFCTFDTDLELSGAWFGDRAYCPSDDGYAETMIEGNFDSLYVIGR